jgi:hypothetical protein
MMICILLVFSGFVVHPSEQLLSQVQFFNPTRVLGADLLRASFTGSSESIEMVNWLFDLNSFGNRTELLIECQKKKILATKLKQVIIFQPIIQTTNLDSDLHGCAMFENDRYGSLPFFWLSSLFV